MYLFDEDGYFIGSKVAQESPRIGGKYLFPLQSTTVEPQVSDEYFACWTGEKWEYEKKPQKVEDFVGLEISHTSQTSRNVELRALLQRAVENSTGWRVVRGPESEGLWWGVERIPETTELEKKESRISELKGNLSSTDYVVAKIAEGVATKEEYAQVLADRQEWRAEINALEAELNKA